MDTKNQCDYYSKSPLKLNMLSPHSKYNSHFRPLFDEGTVCDQFICHYQHKRHAVISCVYGISLEK